MKTADKKARERKFFLVLPLIILPFVTMFFWALGGGTGASGQENGNFLSSLNTNLPDAKSQDAPKDKLSYYELAERDSARLLELIKRDSNYQFDELDSPYRDTDAFGNGYRNYGNPMADQIYKGLNDLEREMNTGYAHSSSKWQQDSYGSASSYGNQSGGYRAPSNQLYELEQMMNQSQPADPEIDQLNTMLDKIMEIQNPDLANERLKESSSKRRGEVFSVSKDEKGKHISLLDSASPIDTPSGFYSLDKHGFSTSAQNAIQAVVHEDQTIVNGSIIKLRLINEVYINGVKIPKDNFLFGVAQLSGERLGIKIESIRYGNSLFPVELAVYDMDGLDGIYIPGSIARDVAKESVDRPLQSINLGSLDPSWGSQAAGAGVEVVKGLFSKKAKLVKVKVKAGYQILLRDQKQKQSQGE